MIDFLIKLLDQNDNIVDTTTNTVTDKELVSHIGFLILSCYDFSEYKHLDILDKEKLALLAFYIYSKENTAKGNTNLSNAITAICCSYRYYIDPEVFMDNNAIKEFSKKNKNILDSLIKNIKSVSKNNYNINSIVEFHNKYNLDIKVKDLLKKDSKYLSVLGALCIYINNEIANPEIKDAFGNEVVKNINKDHILSNVSNDDCISNNKNLIYAILTYFAKYKVKMEMEVVIGYYNAILNCAKC